jgi:hypothetical protein
MVVYDPNDPHMALYDVDSGALFSIYEFIDAENDTELTIEATIITLAEW